MKRETLDGRKLSKKCSSSPELRNSGLLIIKVHQASSILKEKRPVFTGISLVWHFRSIRTEKNLKVFGKNNQVTYQNVYIRLASPISAASLVARRQWTNGIDILRQGCFYSRIWYQAKLYKRENKDIFRCSRFRKFSSTSPFLGSYKGVIQERERHGN